MSAPLPTDLPVAPLPVSVIAAMHRIEVRLAAVPNGESLTINGVTCTAVSLRVADLLARHDRLQSRCRRLSAKAVTSEDYNQLFDWHVFLTDCRCQLEAAGALHLVEGHEKAKEPTLPQRPRGPYPQCAKAVV